MFNAGLSDGVTGLEFEQDELNRTNKTRIQMTKLEFLSCMFSSEGGGCLSVLFIIIPVELKTRMAKI